MTDPVAQFQIREMVELMQQRPRPTTFLGSNFVRRSQTHRTKYIELDRVFGNQLIARYIDREGGPNVVGKAGYDNLLHVAPYVYEQISYKPSDVDVKLAGTTAYDQTNQLASLVAGWIGDLEDRLIRLEEQQIAQALQTGKITVSGKGTSYEIDFQMAAGHLITLDDSTTLLTMWDDAAAPILTEQLGTWSRLCTDKGAPAPSMMIGDPSAISRLIKNTEVKTYLDNRRIEMGGINPTQLREQRATYIGRLAGPSFDLDVYEYYGLYEYIDGSGDLQSSRYMNTDTVILTSREADYRMHYGKIENFNAPDFRGARLPNRWSTNDGKNRYIGMESSPMYGMHQSDGVVAVKVYTP